MKFFNRKQSEDKPLPVDVARNVNVFTSMARKKTLKMAEEAITGVYESGRLVFKGDKVEYTDKNGAKELQTIDECASDFWVRLNRFSWITTMLSRQGYPLS